MALSKIKNAYGYEIGMGHVVCNCCGAHRTDKVYSGIGINSVKEPIPFKEEKFTKTINHYGSKTLKLITTVRSIPIKGGYIKLETWRYP